MRVKIASFGKYKHLKGKSKYFKGENHQKVTKVRKLQAKKTLKKLASLKSKNAQEIRNFLRVKIASLGKYKHLKGKSKY